MATQTASMPVPVLPVQGAQFAGQTMSRRPFEGTVLTHLVHPLEKHVAAHEHPLPYFSLVLHGHYEEEGRRGFNQYGGFTLAFHPQSTRHTGIVPRGGAEFFTAEVGESWLDYFRGPRSLNEAVYELSAGRDHMADSAVVPRVSRRCARVGAEHGKPLVGDARRGSAATACSQAHTAGVVAATDRHAARVVSRECAACGSGSGSWSASGIFVANVSTGRRTHGWRVCSATAGAAGMPGVARS